MSTHTEAGRLDATTRRVGLLLALGGLLVVVDTVVAVVAVPRILADLDTDIATAQWVTIGYLLGIVAVLPVAGWAAERFGDRRVYVGALLVFTAASLAAGLAPDIATLILVRVVQGLGGGLLNPVGQLVMMRVAPPARLGAAMSVLGLPVLLGPALGLPLAGLLVDHASWRWVFLVNVPLGLLAVVLALVLIPRAAAGRRRRLDVLGLVLLPAATSLVVVAASLVGERRALTTTSGLALALGAALFLTFAAHARRTPDPLVDLWLMRSPRIAPGVVVLVSFGAGYFGSMTLLPLLIQGARGEAASLGAVIGLPQAVTTGVTLLVATRLVDRVEPRRIVRVGLGVALAGTVALAGAVASQASSVTLAVLGAVIGLGSGATIMPTMSTTLRQLHEDERGSGATGLALAQQMASALGAAVVAGVLSVLLAVRLPEAGPVVGLPRAELERLAPDLASTVALAYAPAIVLTVVALLAAARLPGVPAGRPGP